MSEVKLSTRFGFNKLHFSKKSLIFPVIALAGPGLIAANAGNDAGGIATYASAGAQFGYRTLFFMVLVTVALVVVQVMCTRIGAFSGEGLGSLIRENFSIRQSSFALILFTIANIGLVVSEFAGIAAALELFHVSRLISIPIAAILVWTLVVLGSYRRAERLFLLLTLAFITYPIAAILSHPNFHLATQQLTMPHFIYSKSFLLIGVALIGTTITPYMQFYLAGAIPDKGVGPNEYKRERISTVAGAIIANIISMFIIIATASVITHRGPLANASDAARALKPIAGHFATELFAIGLLGASALAAAIVPLSSSYAVSEAIGAERSVSKSYREAPIFTGLFTLQILVGALVAIKPGNLINTLINTQVLNGVITPIILVYILILANNRGILGNAANGSLFKIIATICIAAISLMSLAFTFITVTGWFGIKI